MVFYQREWRLPLGWQRSFVHWGQLSAEATAGLQYECGVGKWVRQATFAGFLPSLLKRGPELVQDPGIGHCSALVQVEYCVMPSLWASASYSEIARELFEIELSVKVWISFNMFTIHAFLSEQNAACREVPSMVRLQWGITQVPVGNLAPLEGSFPTRCRGAHLCRGFC